MVSFASMIHLGNKVILFYCWQMAAISKFCDLILNIYPYGNTLLSAILVQAEKMKSTGLKLRDIE